MSGLRCALHVNVYSARFGKAEYDILHDGCVCVTLILAIFQLDPVETGTRSEDANRHSLVPIRRPSDAGPSPVPATSSSIEEVDLPRWIDSTSDGVQTISNDKPDEITIPGLPSAALPRRAPAIKLRLWNREFVILDGPGPRALIIRTIKSTLLVAKVSPNPYFFFSLGDHQCL